MTFPLTGAMITLISAASIGPITWTVNILKPMVEKLPWADPNVPADKPMHDAMLQLLNFIVSAGSMSAVSIGLGYIKTPADFWIVGVQIIGVVLGADFNYRSSSKSNAGGAAASGPALPLAVAVPPAVVAAALQGAITASTQAAIGSGGGGGGGAPTSRAPAPSPTFTPAPPLSATPQPQQSLTQPPVQPTAAQIAAAQTILASYASQSGGGQP